jgi:hypothetical protein
MRIRLARNKFLGDQVNSLINTSRESAASAGKLTDGVVNSFQQGASKGINDILDNAPDSIRDEMKYRYHNQVNNDAHTLRMQVIAERLRGRRLRLSCPTIIPRLKIPTKPLLLMALGREWLAWTCLQKTSKGRKTPVR